MRAVETTGKNEPARSGEGIFRPRVDSALEAASDCALTLAVAGAGYGKTQAVRAFMWRRAVSVRWLQLTEDDNMCSRFWESFLYVTAQGNPALSEKLRAFGFPETEQQFKRYIALTKRSEADVRFVFDDFHTIGNPRVLRFV